MPFPLDVWGLLEESLAKNRRPPDGKLHPSGALTGSIRHLQLEVAGAPTRPPDLVSEVNLRVGTDLHAYFENEVFRGQPMMTEVKLDRWLPEGWSGTADWLAWDVADRAFVLGDLKSCKPGSIYYLMRDGAKESQIKQVSVYWHACVGMGLPMADRFYIAHLPKNQNSRREGEPVKPVMNECVPSPLETLVPLMEERKAHVDAYLEGLAKAVGAHGPVTLGDWLVPELAPVQDRIPALRLNKTLKVPCLDLKLEPSWSVDYCPFPSELCNCSEQTASKVGGFTLDEDNELVFTFSRGQDSPENRKLVELNMPREWQVADLVGAVRAKSA